MTTKFLNLPNRANILVPSDRRAESIECSFEGIVGKRMSLVSSERLPPSTPVTVEYNDAMFLGEVVACAHGCDDTWHMEVKVEQILTGLRSLIKLRERLLGESFAGSPDTIPLRVSARS